MEVLEAEGQRRGGTSRLFPSANGTGNLNAFLESPPSNFSEQKLINIYNQISYNMPKIAPKFWPHYQFSIIQSVIIRLLAAAEKKVDAVVACSALPQEARWVFPSCKTQFMSFSRIICMYLEIPSMAMLLVGLGRG